MSYEAIALIMFASMMVPFVSGWTSLVESSAVGALVASLAALLKGRYQTYSGPALTEHVVKPTLEQFNKIAAGRMEFELFTGDQLVPTGEVVHAMQFGTIDMVQSDDDSMTSPIEVTVFGGYFPFASRYLLDVPALFNRYDVGENWDAEYANAGVKWLSAGSWDLGHIANQDRYVELPGDMKALLDLTMDHARYYHQWRYWGGEADLRVNRPKMHLTSIPDDEWQTVEDAATVVRDEITQESEVKAKVAQTSKIITPLWQRLANHTVTKLYCGPEMACSPP